MNHTQEATRFSTSLLACRGAAASGRRRVTSQAVNGAVLLALSAAVNAQTVHTFPQCGGTLQSCIDAAAAGDIVEIATSTPIDESPRLQRSVVLRSATGVQATLKGFNRISAFSTGDQPTRFVIRGIRLETGDITVGNGGSVELIAVVRDNVVTGGNTSFAGIGFRTGNIGEARGDTKLRIIDNVIHMPSAFSHQRNGISISNSLSPKVTAIISGNEINLEESSQGDAISLPNGSNRLEVRVVGNRITGRDYGSGISLFQFSDGGDLDARLLNNLITDENGNAGRPAGISVSASKGNINVEIVNNTVARNRNGISIGGRKDLGASMSGLIVNNVVAHNENIGLSIDPDFQETVKNRFNLVFGNGSDFFVPGTGTVQADPLFRGADSYDLQLTSPAVDRGQNSALPASIGTDLPGRPRIANNTIDIGAFEAPCKSGKHPGARWKNLSKRPKYVRSGACS